MSVPYYFRLHQGTGVSVRAYLNDLLFYKGTGSENMTVTSPCNHLLVPGENVFALEVHAAPRPAIGSAGTAGGAATGGVGAGLN